MIETSFLPPARGFSPLSGQTPWSGKAWRRQAQILYPSLPLRDGMKIVARAYALAIPRWEGNWASAQRLFADRARSAITPS
jgi:hypothetical protein